MRTLISQRFTIDIHGTPCDLLESNYSIFLGGLGIHLVPVSNFSTPTQIDSLWTDVKPEGIILTGGNDVDPASYGATPLGSSDHSPLRDDVERELIRRAIQEKLPILGICRGMQFLNIFFGGSLIQDPESKFNLPHPPGQDHEVTLLTPEIRDYFGSTRWWVNSYHRQAVTIECLGEGLHPFAMMEETPLIEGLYHESLPIAGVQFHPERRLSRASDHFHRTLSAFKKRELFWSVRP